MRDRKLNTTDRTQSHSSQQTGKTPTRGSAAPNPRYDPLAKIMRQTGNSASSQAAMLNRAPSLASRSLLQLQRQHGNRYVQRVLAISRQGEESGEVSPEVEAGIQRQHGGGQALERPVKSQMESAFGTDFSSVRVHANAEANKLNEALNARAFTTGQDIFFRQGEYSPNSSQGKELLAHELTHVVQQAGGIQGKLRVSQPGDRSEQEADRMAKIVASNRDIESISSEQGKIARDDGEGEEAPSEPRGSEARPYEALAEAVRWYALDLYDTDLAYDDHIAQMKIWVTWHKINWRGNEVWIPHNIRTENSHFRGITLGGEVNASFASGPGSRDLLSVRLAWINSIGTADVERRETTNLTGQLSASQKNSLAAKATVPVRGVPVEASAGSERTTGGSLSFSHSYDRKYTDPGALVTLSTHWHSLSGSGVSFRGTPAPPLDLLADDETLQEHYAGWFEGSLDLELRESGDLRPEREE